MRRRAIVGLMSVVCLVALVGLVAIGTRAGVSGDRAPSTAADRCTIACSASLLDSALRSGSTDAWPPLQAALNAAIEGSAVMLPAGRFELSHPLVVPHGVELAGAGQDGTFLVAAPDAGSNFRMDFIVGAAQDSRDGDVTTTVRDFAILGGHDGGPAEAVGGVRAGSGWTISRLHLADLGFFKVWLRDVRDVTVSDCRFADVSGTSSGHDNVGGGTSADIAIVGNVFEESARGNAIDLVRSTDVVIKDNTIRGTPDEPHNVYLEGIVGASVVSNALTASSLAVQSNADYDDHESVTNPRAVVVEGNSVTDPNAQGISIRYDDPREGQPLTARSGAVGGGNRVIGNTVTRAGVAGIAVIAAAPGLVEPADTVSGNTVADAFADGDRTWNCGYGVTAAVGILIGAGEGVDMYRNTITNSGAGAAEVGIAVGLRSTRAVPVSATGLGTTRTVGLAETVVYQS